MTSNEPPPSSSAAAVAPSLSSSLLLLSTPEGQYINNMFNKLDADLIKRTALSYLDRYTDLMSVAGTCVFFRDLVFGWIDMWQEEPVNICIDSACLKFGCGRVPLSKNKAFLLLVNAPVDHVRLHLPFASLATSISVISTNVNIKKLSVKLRLVGNIINRKPYQKILTTFSSVGTEKIITPMSLFTTLLAQNNFDKATSAALCLCKLTHLTVYGWPEYSIQLRGGVNLSSFEYCKRFLGFVGSSLESLQFLETSPLGLVGFIDQSCCNLKNLKIEGAQMLSEIMNYKSELLEDLCLQETGILLKGKLQFPNLISIDLVDSQHSNWRSAQDVVDCIHALPTSLMELRIKVNSEYANELLSTIGSYLCNLHVLRLKLTDCQEVLPNDIEPSSITAMIDGCPSLQYLEIVDSLINFETVSFQLLASFPNLNRLRIRYEDLYVDLLPQLLLESQSLTDIEFFESQDDIIAELGEEHWHIMERKIDAFEQQFPEVNVSLENVIAMED